MADIVRIIAFKGVRRLAILVLVAVCLGCAGQNLEGRWVGYRNLTKPDGTRDFLTEMAGKVELEFKPGNKFDLYEGGYPKSGTVRYENGKAYLRIERLMGKPVAEHGDATVAMNDDLILTKVDADTLTLVDPRGYDKEPIRLTRDAQPSESPARK
jgi:hypothetical protein